MFDAGLKECEAVGAVWLYLAADAVIEGVD